MPTNGNGNGTSLTRKFLAGAVIAIVGYETWTLLNMKPGDTISDTVWKANRRPLIPFAVGMLCGHWFWQRVDDGDD